MDKRSWNFAAAVISLLVIGACRNDDVGSRSATPIVAVIPVAFDSPYSRDAEATGDGDGVPACGGTPCNHTTRRCCSGYKCCWGGGSNHCYAHPPTFCIIKCSGC
jgi:hypothetical protein